MKNLILCAFSLAAFSVSNAQEAKFGVKAGVDVATSINKFQNFFASGRQTNTETGFFVGGFVDISLSQKVHVQPELLYTKIQDLEFLHLPIILNMLWQKSLIWLQDQVLDFY
jgi:hypothetical protein